MVFFSSQVRLGQLGAIQLYLKLLQSDSIEEQSLGTAGIWILAFSDENKYLISKVHGCMEGKILPFCFAEVVAGRLLFAAIFIKHLLSSTQLFKS